MPSAMAYVDGGYPSGTFPDKLVAAVAPSVQNLNVNTASGQATVSFNLNTNSTATVWIKDSNDTIVKTLLFDSSLNGGTNYSYVWNGATNEGVKSPSGNYKAQVVAYNAASSDIKSFLFSFTASDDGNNGNELVAPVITASATPIFFDPDQGQQTTITYSLNTQASLGVYVKLNNSIVKTLRAQNLQNQGTYTLNWDGRNDAGTLMAPNAFTVELYANNVKGSDTKTLNVTIVKVNTETAPKLSNLEVNPSTFNPNTQNTNISFNTDKNANVLVEILNGNTVVRTLNNSNLPAGNHGFVWDGKDSNGNVVGNGTYTVRVTASNNGGSDTLVAPVTVNIVTNPTACNLVTSSYVSPTSFDPNSTNSTLTFALSKQATVSVIVKSNNTIVRTFAQNKVFNAGSSQVIWNGKNDNNNNVAKGSYTFEITASTNNCYTETVTGVVTVTNDGNEYENDWPSTNEDLIKNVQVLHEVFNPLNGEYSTIQFDLTNKARLKVEVLDGNKVVKTLRNSQSQSAGTYSYSWDGRDNNGYIMKDAIYTYRIMADDGKYTDTDRALTEVDTDGIRIGFPVEARCAGYSDVSIYSPFCKAIQLMSTKKIFEGYPDGTFRPYEPINRAETAKVVVLALGYEVNLNGFFGKQYLDTLANAWYAPYLEVARKFNIATGYPDGTFRPSNTINRVELLRVFLEANHMNLTTCGEQPYEDTPINADTLWYIKYACYAKANNLMGNGSKLYPADAMTEGDVANLFYQFEIRGLYAGYDKNTSISCLETNSLGNCTKYVGVNNNSSTQYCAVRDSNGVCLRWTTETDSVYNNNTVNLNDNYGYYVYQDGKYIWISY